MPNAGGGIFNVGTLTLRGCAVRGNSVGSSYYSATSSITSAGYGGGIYNAGTLTVISSLIANNRAKANASNYNILNYPDTTAVATGRASATWAP